jgi:hypothetical protein
MSSTRKVASMGEITHGVVPTPADSLHAELRTLIASTRQRLAGAVNAELTRLYWAVGQSLRTEVLGDGRASYGTQLLDQLGQQLAQEFGRGFESRNLRRMVKFAESFPDAAIVSTLSTQLSWSHMVAIVALKTPQARQYYASLAAQDGWSVRELAHQIERKAFERTELASLQVASTVRAEPVEASTTSPAQIFKDPYFLDFLGLRQGHDEADLEASRKGQAGEESPIGLILCAESSREQVELLQMHKDGITVADYWTELPPKAELEQHLHQALIEARERLARRGCCWRGMRICDGNQRLKFPVVALPDVGRTSAPGEDDAALVFYVAATRATQRLVMGVGGGSAFSGSFAQQRL